MSKSPLGRIQELVATKPDAVGRGPSDKVKCDQPPNTERGKENPTKQHSDENRRVERLYLLASTSRIHTFYSRLIVKNVQHDISMIMLFSQYTRKTSS